MNIVLLPYSHKIDYFIDLVSYSQGYNLVAIVASPTFFNALKNDPRCLSNNIEVVDNICNVSVSYDAIVDFTGILNSSNCLNEYLKVNRINKKIISIVSDENKREQREKNILTIDVPIITVSKTNSKTNALKFICSLKSKLENEGYNVLVISPDCTANVMGFYDSAKILYSANSIDEKIIEFNREVSNLVNKYKAQVLIIDVPGDIDDDYNYITQKSVKGDYNIVLVEPFNCSENSFSMLEKEIMELYCGKVHDIVVSEYAMNFIEDDCECGIPIKENSLKKLCNSKLTVYDIESIYSKIKDYFSNPKIL